MRRPALVRLAVAAAVIAFAVSVIVPSLAAQSVVNGMAEEFHTASLMWAGRLLRNAQRIFVLLAGFEVVASAMILLLKGKKLDEAVGGFVLKILIMSICFFAITSFELVVPAIYESFIAAGQNAAVVPSLNPSTIAGMGIATAGAVLSGMTHSPLVFIPGVPALMLCIALLIILAFTGIACQMVYTLVEGYVVMSAGVFYLGFASFRGTAALADNYLMYLVHVGTKLFMLYLLVPIGGTIAGTWKNSLQSAAFYDISAPCEVLIGACIFCGLVMFLPGSFASRITSGANLGIAQALRSN